MKIGAGVESIDMGFKVARCPGKRSEQDEVEGLLYSFNGMSD